MKIHKATERYEAWLGKHLRLLPADLSLKHEAMATGAYAFLRATFYRWAQLWERICPELADAPGVLAVGDLHIENFGTWRDADGRLVWGVNDFDEAFPLPYTNDLVRLAASALVAIAENHLAAKPADACEAILRGYHEGIEAGGRPFVLEEHHHWLREVAMGVLRDPGRFWEKMDGLPAVKDRIPKGARKALEAMMPEKGLEYRVAHRAAGLGSLGRERYVALAEWRGGKVAREAKALAPSAWIWAAGEQGLNGILYDCILEQAVRVPDPFVRLKGRWIVRRLAPHCSRIELASLPKERDEARLLQAMGFETANIHAGDHKAAKKIGDDLGRRRVGWLRSAGEQMAEAVSKDWKDWRGH